MDVGWGWGGCILTYREGAASETGLPGKGRSRSQANTVFQDGTPPLFLKCREVNQEKNRELAMDVAR